MKLGTAAKTSNLELLREQVDLKPEQKVCEKDPITNTNASILAQTLVSNKFWRNQKNILN